VTKLGFGWLSERDGWLSRGSNTDISQKYKMGDISKGVANTKNIYKKTLSGRPWDQVSYNFLLLHPSVLAAHTQQGPK
jgi:hypothetical protein